MRKAGIRLYCFDSGLYDQFGISYNGNGKCRFSDTILTLGENMRKNKRNSRHSRKIEKKAGGLFAGVFTGCILLLAAVNLLMPDKEMSAAEGRRLESRPEMSVDGLLSGDYMKKYEEYFSDQFVGRNLFRNIKVVLNRIGGSREENGVLIGKNGHLFETIAVPHQEKLQANLEAIEQFTKKNRDINVNMILVPDAASVLGEELPMFYSTADQERMIAQVRRELEGSVNWIDAGSVMHKHKEEALDDKTDKHWTSTGAYYVFEAAAGQLGIAENITGKFASYPVSASFNGNCAIEKRMRNGHERNNRYLYADQRGFVSDRQLCG